VSHLLPWALSSLVFMPIAFPFLAASYVLFVVHEQGTKSKLLQLMTGLPPVIYWLANFLFDMFNHLVAITSLYMVIYFFDSEHIFFASNQTHSTGSTLYFILASFGFSVIPMVYAVSYFFTKPSSAFISLTSTFF